MSAAATRKPVSSASSRAAASASRSPARTSPPTVNHHLGAVLSGDASAIGRIRPAQQQHRAGLVEQHHPRRRAVVEHPVIAVRQRVGPLDDLEIAWQRRGSAEPKGPHQESLAQRERVADRVVVEAAGQQHPRLGVGQLRDQARRQRRRVDHRQRGRELVLARLPRVPGRVLRGVGERRPAAGRSGPRRRTRRSRPHAPPPRAAPAHRPAPATTGRSGRAAGPAGWRSDTPRRRTSRQRHDQHRDGDDQPRHQLATCTLAPDPATVS